MRNKILTILEKNQDFVSGEAMSEMLGISRAAIWKHIQLLVESGYEIESVRNRGYRLVSEADHLNREAIESLMETVSLGRQCHYLETVDSTNVYLKRLTQESPQVADGLLVVANEQTAGRGRRGRQWTSPKGQGIFMSYLLKMNLPMEQIPQLTLVAGLAVCEAMREMYGQDLKIKWPNDVVYNSKKVCGILTEMSGVIGENPEIIVGIGINASQMAFSEEIAHKATSIRLMTGEKVNRARLIATVTMAFEQLLQLFVAEGLDALVKRFNDLCVNVGLIQTASGPGVEIKGTGLGINNSGELMLQTVEGVKNISSGEISVEGIY